MGVSSNQSMSPAKIKRGIPVKRGGNESESGHVLFDLLKRRIGSNLVNVNPWLGGDYLHLGIFIGDADHSNIVSENVILPCEPL